VGVGVPTFCTAENLYITFDSLKNLTTKSLLLIKTLTKNIRQLTHSLYMILYVAFLNKTREKNIKKIIRKETKSQGRENT